MKKTGLYIFSILCLAVYALSLNRPFMGWWADFRTYKLHAAFAKARYGDLYSNCYLPGYTDTAYIPLKEYQNENPAIDLYIIHDSYLEGKVKKENFKNVANVVLSDFRGGTVNSRLNKLKRNILIIECSERTADWRLTDTATLFSRFNFKGTVNKNEVAETAENEPLENYFFNPNINQNLEFNLYDYEYFIPLKNLKAQVNFSLFNRLPKDVSVSSDKKYLFLTETVDPFSGSSSFIPLSPERIDYATSLVNLATDYFKNLGFEEVYFSIVPNPVSILETKPDYNHKIDMLQNNHLLKGKYIKVFDQLKNSNKRVYRTDDSHWNGNGIQIWVDEVNKTIAP